MNKEKFVQYIHDIADQISTIGIDDTKSAIEIERITVAIPNEKYGYVEHKPTGVVEIRIVYKENK